MMPMTRAQIEVLLDSPDRQAFVVSVYADMTVKDGFSRHLDQTIQNQARDAGRALSEAETRARQALEANLEAVRSAVLGVPDPSAPGLAVFSNVETGLLHVMPLNFRVDHKIVVDEAAYVLPLLERWYGEPEFLVVLVDANHAQFFATRNGVPEPIDAGRKPDIDDDIQRDKPRFADKKRFAATRHERLNGMIDSKFLDDMAGRAAEHWKRGDYAGLILLGQTAITGPFRSLLPRELADAVVETAPQAMTDRPEDVQDDVARALNSWRAGRESALLGELEQRWKEGHLVGNGPTDVLDALQQGRATEIVVGQVHELPGAICRGCGYRFGAPVATCVYCGGTCRNVNSVQEILKMAMKQKAPVYLFPNNGALADPLARGGGVCALLRAPANWAPDSETARATRGH